MEHKHEHNKQTHNHKHNEYNTDLLAVPVLRFLKEPVWVLSELYNRYPDGGQWGWCAFVVKAHTFAAWDVKKKIWRYITAECNCEPKTPDTPEPCDCVPSYIETTHTELKQLITENKLVKGQHYLIADFRTAWKQDIINAAGTDFEELESFGEIEPIIVQAANENSLHIKAISTLYPLDQLFYNIDGIDVSGMPPLYRGNNHKGLIIRRIDSHNNSIPYDHRAIKWRRYAVDYSLIPRWNVNTDYSKPAGSYSMNANIVTDADGYTYNVYVQKATSVPVGANPTQYNSPYWEKVLYFENYGERDYLYIAHTGINAQKSRDILLTPQQMWDGSVFYTSMQFARSYGQYVLFPIIINKFKDCYTFSNKNDDINYCDYSKNNIHNSLYLTYKGIFSNYIGDGSFGFVFLNQTQSEIDISFNIIGNYFNYNTIEHIFNSNKIGNNCSFNIINNGFENNVIGNKFHSNIIDNYFNSNNIGNVFIFNIINNGFIGNVVGNKFMNNLISGQSEHNIIGNYFSSNIIGTEFANNSVGNNFYENTTGNIFTDSSIGNGFNKNFLIADGVKGWNICSQRVFTGSKNWGIVPSFLLNKDYSITLNRVSDYNWRWSYYNFSGVEQSGII